MINFILIVIGSFIGCLAAIRVWVLIDEWKTKEDIK